MYERAILNRVFLHVRHSPQLRELLPNLSYSAPSKVWPWCSIAPLPPLRFNLSLFLLTAFQHCSSPSLFPVLLNLALLTAHTVFCSLVQHYNGLFKTRFKPHSPPAFLSIQWFSCSSNLLSTFQSFLQTTIDSDRSLTHKPNMTLSFPDLRPHL